MDTFFRGDEHPFTSYFDVHQGYTVLTHCHILYIYLRRGGRKPVPKAMLMVFFVSALKYLEVKAVASC